MRFLRSLGAVVLGLGLVSTGAGWAQSPGAGLPPPLADYHMHLQSPELSLALQRLAKRDPALFQHMDAGFLSSRSGPDALRVLDQGGIRYGVLLSEAYMASSPFSSGDNLDVPRFTRSENAYNVAAAAHSNGRLVAFIGVNPLSATALPEIAYWHRAGGASGVKLHLGNDKFDFNSAADVEALRGVFAAAGRDRLPIIIHLRGSDAFGANEVNTFIGQVLPSAGQDQVQVAHAGGWGGLDLQTVSALETFAKAIGAHRPGTQHLTFDLALVVVDTKTDKALAARLAAAMRAIGIERFAFGSDWPSIYTPATYARLLVQQVPLTDTEWRTIFAHRASYIGAPSPSP